MNTNDPNCNDPNSWQSRRSKFLLTLAGVLSNRAAEIVERYDERRGCSVVTENYTITRSKIEFGSDTEFRAELLPLELFLKVTTFGTENPQLPSTCYLALHGVVMPTSLLKAFYERFSDVCKVDSNTLKVGLMSDNSDDVCLWFNVPHVVLTSAENCTNSNSNGTTIVENMCFITGEPQLLQADSPSKVDNFNTYVRQIHDMIHRRRCCVRPDHVVDDKNASGESDV